MKDKKIELIKEYCKDQRVLDVGCWGTSITMDHPRWLHKHLTEVSKSVLGIDIDEDGLKQMEKEGYSVEFSDASSFDLNREFDVIVAGELIEHLSNPGMFLDCCKEHLGPDGTLILTTPNKDGLYAYLIQQGPHPKQRKKFSSGHNHVAWYCVHTMKELLARHGFQTEICQAEEHFPAKTITGKLWNFFIPNKWKDDMIVIAKKRWKQWDSGEQ